MSEQRSIAIKNYINQTFVHEDPILLKAKQNATDLPPIAIPEQVGKLLYLLTQLQKPKRILEIGTLAGYSTLWLAKAAPNATILTIEQNPIHAAQARTTFAELNYSIILLEEDAKHALARLVQEGDSFDLIFLDAAKEEYPSYFPFIVALAHPGTLLLTDNLIPKGNITLQPAPKDIQAIKIYEYNRLLANHPALETALATTIVGDQGRIDALGISIFS